MENRIKIQEVRIGNIVLWNGDQVAWEVFMYDCPNPNIDGDYDICGIPITPEWLEKIGFEKDETHNIYVLWQPESGPEMGFTCEYRYVYLSRNDCHENLEHIKHIHQLQNLYFALTGEELEIKI